MGNKNTNDKLTAKEIKLLRSTQKLTSMSKEDLAHSYKEFKRDYPNGEIDKAGFARMVGDFLPENQRSPMLIDRLFNAFDTDNSGGIDFREFMIAISLSSSDNPEEKLLFCFRSLDVNNDGHLTRSEVLHAVELLFKHYPGMEDVVAEQLNSPEKVVEQIFSKVDSNGDGMLTPEELITFMKKHPKTFNYLGLNHIFLS